MYALYVVVCSFEVVLPPRGASLPNRFDDQQQKGNHVEDQAECSHMRRVRPVAHSADDRGDPMLSAAPSGIGEVRADLAIRSSGVRGTLGRRGWWRDPGR